jgi:hypothetical protein
MAHSSLCTACSSPIATTTAARAAWTARLASWASCKSTPAHYPLCSDTVPHGPCCQPAVSAAACSFKTYIDTVFGEKMNLLTDVVSRSAASGSPLDLHDHMYRFTLDSFGQIGFGVDPGCLRTTDKVPFAAAFDSAQVVSVWEAQDAFGVGLAWQAVKGAEVFLMPACANAVPAALCVSLCHQWKHSVGWRRWRSQAAMAA